MNLPVVLTRDAEMEFDAAADWYEGQAGLGAKFTVRVREALNRIGKTPESSAVLHETFGASRSGRSPTTSSTESRLTESR